METLNDIKDRVQRECLNTWYKQGCNSTAEIATGVGKTRIGVLAAEYVYRTIKDVKILILTPTQVIRDSAWKDEFAKWGHKRIFDRNVESVCIQTACKYENQHYDLIIVDEIHNYLGAGEDSIYYSFFGRNSYDKILGLSASIDSSLLPRLNAIAPICYTLGINKAVELGLVAPFIIINVPIKLTVSERYYYAQFNATFAETFDVFGNDLNLMFSCLKNKKLYRQHLNRRFNTTRSAPDIQDALFRQYESYPYKCNEAMRERKKILYC